MSAPKRIVSISLGSSRRNHAVEAEFLGQRFRIERIGTDGDMERAIAMIRELDGKVDAFGMGGIDLYICAGNRRYILRDAKRIARAARQTPIVDGSGLKNTLERKVVQYLAGEAGIPLAGRKVLLVAGVDRFGMAEALVEAGAEVTFGDLIFGLGIPLPLKSLRSLDLAARLLAPIVCQLPFEMLYPTGEKQEQVTPRYSRFYQQAEIIAGDFHFIRRYMPQTLVGQTILTNTVTAEDIDFLRRRGAGMLITTTPELEGRSFGTNVLEGLLVVLAGKPADQITAADYHELLDRIGMKPRIVKLA
ncbi:MAG: quinate 5-dehydrogenase [Syntrophomonadaceae bacterium]|nr:quinate 5-dehydrogenase [Syntrophomonadaceae bacterium]